MHSLGTGNHLNYTFTHSLGLILDTSNPYTSISSVLMTQFTIFQYVSNTVNDAQKKTNRILEQLEHRK